MPSSPPQAQGVPAAVSETIVEVPQGDIDAVEQALIHHRGRVAAVLIDLMPNRAGLVPARVDDVARLADLTREHGALLAVDEVITFRLEHGGLHTRYGLNPDLISLGKVIGGGFAVGAIGGRAEILSSFSPLSDGAVAWGRHVQCQSGDHGSRIGCTAPILALGRARTQRPWRGSTYAAAGQRS